MICSGICNVLHQYTFYVFLQYIYILFKKNMLILTSNLQGMQLYTVRRSFKTYIACICVTGNKRCPSPGTLASQLTGIHTYLTHTHTPSHMCGVCVCSYSLFLLIFSSRFIIYAIVHEYLIAILYMCIVSLSIVYVYAFIYCNLYLVNKHTNILTNIYIYPF